MSERALFDKATALAKIGQRVRTTVEFSGVPRETIGLVIRADEGELLRTQGCSEPGYILAIQWELGERVDSPLVDWFTRSEYERFLVEL